MRTLRFIVNGQNIERDPSCDFTNLIPGTEGYLQAEFSFSKEWSDSCVVAAFYSPLGYEYEPQLLKQDGTCAIPNGACAVRMFKIKLIGKRADGMILVTEKIVVTQDGGA